MNKLLQTTIVMMILALATVLAGCVTNTTPIMECEPPLMYSGDRCCMDADANGICDVDEEEVTPIIVDENSDTREEDLLEEEKVEVKDISTEGKKTKADAEAVAQLFVDKWNYKSFNMMFSLFTPELKAKKNAREFQTVMELESIYKKIEKVDFKGSTVQDGDEEGEVTFIAHTNVQEIKLPAVKLVYVDGSWRISAFADIFELDTFDAACSAYSDEAGYTIEECAKDFAVKMQDDSYCEDSGCFYIECMKGTGNTITLANQIKECELCPELHASQAECVLDLAIEKDKIAVCNELDDRKYSDKYCTCFGGFAAHKNNVGFCNMIQDPGWKDLCVKKFNGEYC